MLLLGGGIGLFFWLKSMREDTVKQDPPKRIKEVEVREVRNGTLNTTLDVQGSLQAYNEVDLFTEVGGRVLETGRPYKEGTYFPKGSVLLRIDDTEARLNLQSQKASFLNGVAQIMPDLRIDYAESAPAWERYLNDFDVDTPIKELPEPQNRREKLFISGRNLYTQYYTIKSLEDRLNKYTLYAPFSGVLTTAAVDEGAVIRPGQQLGTLMGTGYYELVATVPLSQLKFLQPGGNVALYSDDIEGSWTGKVKRIADQLDAATQTVDVYIGVSGKDLREGMYLRGEAQAVQLDNVVEIDRDLLVDERAVYVVERDTILTLQPVAIRKTNRQTVIVSGLDDGARLLTSDVAGPYDGMRVKIASAKNEETTFKASAEDGVGQSSSVSPSSK